MGTYNEEGYSLDTIIAAQFYDSRFDSLFMVKAYFTDESNQPFGGYQKFKAALRRVSVINGMFRKDTVLPINLNTIFNADLGELTIFPLDDVQQQLINNQNPGYFVVEIEANQAMLGGWLLSMSYSNNMDFLSRTTMNLFTPNKLVVEAGLPFTFNTEISGTTSLTSKDIEKQLQIVSAKKTNMPFINTNMESFSLLSEAMNRVNYVSFYETRAGTYEISLKVTHTKLGV